MAGRRFADKAGPRNSQRLEKKIPSAPLNTEDKTITYPLATKREDHMKKIHGENESVNINFTTTRSFVEYFIKKNEIKLNGCLDVVSSKEIDLEQIPIEMNRLLEKEVGCAQKIVNTKVMLSEYHLQIKSLIEKENKERFKKIMTYKKDENHNLKKLINLIYPESYDDRVELDNIDKRMSAYYALQNFIGQVKLKELGKQHFYPMMVILSGTLQGAGKSKIIEHILSPIKTMVAQVSLSMITDERCTPMRKDFRVLHCDEMQGAGRMEIEAFKSVVTETESNYRPMYSNHTVKIKHNAVLIGTSNKFTFETMKDTTGNRRLFDIDVMTKVDIQELHKIDALAIWQDVNVEAQTYNNLNLIYENFIYKVQAEFKNEDPIEEFIGEMNMETGNRWVSYGKIDFAFLEYGKSVNRFDKLNRRDFHMKLKKVHGFRETIRDGRHGIWLTKEAEERILRIGMYSLSSS